MSKYDRQIASAARLLEAKGQPMTLFRIGFEEVYDPVNPAAAVPTVDDQDGSFGVVLPANDSSITLEALDNRVLEQPLVVQGYRYVLLAGQGLELEPGPEDLLSTNEGVYRVLAATKLDPSGEGAIIYNVGCTLDVQLNVNP